MAVIIMVVILTLIAILGYTWHNAKTVRKKERSFYDIFFLFKFFEYLLKTDAWDEFVKNDVQVEVKRTIFKLEKCSSKKSLGIDENYFFYLTDKNNIMEDEENKNIYIIYEFKLSKKSVKLCMVISSIHNKMFKLINDTTFILNVNAQKLKITLTDSFTQTIYISSYKGAMQSLMFIAQVLSEEQLKTIFNVKYDFLEETYRIIDSLKIQNYFYI